MGPQQEQQRIQYQQPGNLPKQEEQENNPGTVKNQDLPPFVKTWKQFYLLLIGWLIFLIAAFYLFTKHFQ